MVGCSAFGCTNRSEQGFSMKTFPTDLTKRTIWTIAVNRKNWSPSPHSRICEVHFEADQFEKPDAEGKIKLKRSAVPSLFAHKKPLKKRPPPKIRAPPPKRQKTHSEVLQIKKEIEDIDQVQPDDSNLKIHSEVLENEKEEENIDQAQHDDSEYVMELKRKLKIVTDENRMLRSQLSVLTSFLKENQFSVRTYKNN